MTAGGPTGGGPGQEHPDDATGDEQPDQAEAAVRGEDAYRSPAARPAPPPAPSSGVRRGRGRPAADGEQPPETPAWGTPDGTPGGTPPAAPWTAASGPSDTRWSMDPASAEPVPPARAPVAQPAPPPVAGTGVFRVIVEQNVGNGGDYRWAVEPAPTLAFPTREAARDGALEACRRFEPKHPFSEQRRRIFRVTPDEYVVTVDGLTTGFHFRVSVAEEIG
ncbi:MAG: hypothetical protein HY830_09915 [Actinobacteria bacterium]|nr:hypothetical protein [Actinomycetota bacterium]